jgi:hypothetical protein
MISLGLNCTRTHNSSVCIVCVRELLLTVAEERLSCVKYIQACLDFAGVRPDQLDKTEARIAARKSLRKSLRQFSQRLGILLAPNPQVSQMDSAVASGLRGTSP